MPKKKATPKEREAMHKTQPKRVMHVTGPSCNRRRMTTAGDTQ